jgi:hypothetical protein
MKPIRLANLASQMCNESKAWAGCLDPEEMDEHRKRCDAIKKAIRVVILNSPQYIIDLADRELEKIGMS